ncbi:hypothetical protein JKP88DRAFT_161772 [Tribonema minus]|uniref:Uncharacterized protein n=1 Tax=Tribonema minus TaxID=303371 RepID=A0A836CIP0_9STRA|nr:hypothetical protein JKP88DRAFT_161772 [Tribonema minus]
MSFSDPNALLVKHMPVYYTACNESEEPVNLTTYMRSALCEKDKTVSGVCQLLPTAGALLHYFLFFMRDTGMSIFGINGVGGHDYDIEQVVIELGADANVKAVFYTPHSASEHFCISDEADLNIILVDGVRPRVYVSQGKHAQYPVPGTVRRYLGLANDTCKLPVRQEFGVTVLDKDIRDSVSIGTFEGIKKRLEPAVLNVPTVRINHLRNRMLCKLR